MVIDATSFQGPELLSSRGRRENGDVHLGSTNASVCSSNDNRTFVNGGISGGLRRRFSGEGSKEEPSISREIGHAAAETYLITGFAFKLLSYLGVGYRWIIRLLALACYAMLLLPGFLQVAYHYYFSSQVQRSIVYGDQPRNRLDLYLPSNADGRKPVVIFVTGGAWIIGYKAWGSFLGKNLAERDIIVACLDYRNFPQGTISDMIKDVSQGISFICNNTAAAGGDPNRVYLVGQSAGAHISACVLLDQAIKESRGENAYWSVSQVKTYFALSGGYNLLNLVDHFNERGLYRSIFLGMENWSSFRRRWSHGRRRVAINRSRGRSHVKKNEQKIERDKHRDRNREVSREEIGRRMSRKNRENFT